MFKGGLLVLTSSPVQLIPHIDSILRCAAPLVSKHLYVHVAPGLQELSEPRLPLVPCTQTSRQFVTSFYSTAASVSEITDIRLILSNLTNNNTKTIPPHPLRHGYDVILTEPGLANQEEILNYVTKCFPNSVKEGPVTVQALPVDLKLADNSSSDEPIKVYDHVVLGGTFDRLHAGHKILLGLSSLLADQSITVGVTDGAMNSKKSLCELMQPIQTRLDSVVEFLSDTKPGLEYKVVPIVDPFGPSIVDERLQCIIVSQETIKGGRAVNSKRAEKGLSTLDTEVIDLVEDPNHAPEEEEKVSSSSHRKRLLGTLLKESKAAASPRGAGSPYIIGLTGGTASGKSSVCRRLEGQGAVVVDCDKLGHQAYCKGTDCFKEVVKAFGKETVGEDGEINRKVLGGKVFSDKAELEKLNQIVWPAIGKLARVQIDAFAQAGKQVVVLDAAVLLEAGWDNMVDEIWVCVVPRNEAVSRLMERNKLSEDVATKRVDAQLTNQQRVDKANVTLSTLWAPEVTQTQVEKAWQLLQQRLQETK